VRFGGTLRFAAGTLGGILAGALAFQWQVFDFKNPASQCVTMGALASAILALVRTSRHVQAVRLVGAFAVLQLGIWWSHGPFPAVGMAVWSAFVGLGMCLIALIFDRLAHMNVRLGKFLVAGPLLGGIYFAATPLLSFVDPQDVLRALWMNAFLGIVIGDGTGLAVEIVELFVASAKAPHAEPGKACAATPAPSKSSNGGP
jgi:hypothetical protein